MPKPPYIVIGDCRVWGMFPKGALETQFAYDIYIHREDGPATECNSVRQYYKNGRLMFDEEPEIMWARISKRMRFPNARRSDVLQNLGAPSPQ